MVIQAHLHVGFFTVIFIKRASLKRFYLSLKLLQSIWNTIVTYFRNTQYFNRNTQYFDQKPWISIEILGISMEYDCHIFLKYLVFQIKNLVFQSKYLGFRSKNQLFRVWNFEILGFSHLEFEILGISSEIPSISKTWNFD